MKLSLVAFRQGPSDAQKCGPLEERPALGVLPLLMSRHLPKFTRPSSSRIPSVSRILMPDILTSTCTQKKRGAPDCFFCWLLPGFRYWQAGEWQRIRGASTSLRQNTSEPNPRLRDQPFDFHVTASLLGAIATAFCRHGQLERPGDVICEGNRRISAAHAPSRSANLFCTVSQFHMSRFAMCIMPVFGVVSFAASGALRSAAVAS